MAGFYSARGRTIPPLPWPTFAPPLSLFEFSQQVAQLVQRWAPAVWVGYNSMKFDEEFLRQIFYQNLQPNVYATQFHGNARFDVLPAIYAVHVRNPGIFDWPIGDNGQVSFKLDRLAPANGFNSHNAHDALGDVEATIHIARMVSQRDPVLWAELLSNVSKRQVQTKLESFRPLELVTRFGGGPPRTYVGCFCGYCDGSDTQAGFFDLLALNPHELIHGDDDALFEAVDGTPKIIRGISTNKAPVLLETINPDQELYRKAKLLADTPEFRLRVGQALAARFVEDPDAPLPPVEQQIYGNFYSAADKQLLEEFQFAGWPRRQQIVSLLSDPRLRQLGNRLIAFYSAELLSDEERARFSAYLRDRWHALENAGVKWTTLDGAKKAISEMRDGGDVDADFLRDIEIFLERFRA